MINKDSCSNIQSIYPKFFERKTQIGLTHVRNDSDRPKRIVVIAHYLARVDQTRSDEKLNFLLRNVKQKFPRDKIILTGDFNR